MSSSILVTGGCRSGKSGHALKIAESLQKHPLIFVATCQPEDQEMQDRVKRHQLERGPEWQTMETPVELALTVSEHGGRAGVMLIDCLTLWISNLMASLDKDERILTYIDALARLMAHPPCDIILVSNEVGCGVVPANALSRRFRDLVGWANQRTAAQCHRVIWMVSGIPVPIKPAPAAPNIIHAWS
jgi:adenosylcobinamide kinase/adenosylcobinamide-phosphate guanylyltransferase